MTENNLKPLTADWKTWIALNLMRGADEQSIMDVLVKQGFPQLTCAVEVQAASMHPYVAAGKQISHTLDKRDWLMQVHNTASQLDPRYAQTVERIDTPPFADFIRDYYSKSIPVVLQKGIEHWRALKNWTPRYFADTIGDAEVEIQFGRETDANFEVNNAELKKTMPMADFVDQIEAVDSSNNFYMTARNTQKSIEGIRPIFDDLGDFGDGYRQLTDDPSYMTYFWMGPKGTFTSIHHDLTHNMLVQLYGRKKVTLFPCWQVPWLYNSHGVFSDVDYPHVDIQQHPLMAKVTPVEVTIGAGDALYIPLAWWHCVESLDSSISISFTNFNAPNNFASTFPN